MADILPFDLPPSWSTQLSEELHEPYLLHLRAFLEEERHTGRQVFPPRDQIFQALQMTSFEDVRVVIVGQDPYHGPGQAHGLSFSVQPGVTIPPSLENIYKEIKEDLKIPPPTHGCLTSWAEQGVLLLNATLTVRAGEPLSHHNRGWERFTDTIIQRIAQEKENVVFLLWGKNAQEKCIKFADLFANHLVLKAAHPSPFSAHNGFFGCHHFSKTNAYLQEHGFEPIDWQVKELSEKTSKRH